MTTSDVYVWIFLPGSATPVVAGVSRLGVGDVRTFTYGQSYLRNTEAIPLGPDLPLRTGAQNPAGDLKLHGTLRDAMPDSWGRRVIEHSRGTHYDLPDSIYMLESGSNRFGALDFQASPKEYGSRGSSVSFDELHSAALLVASGEKLSRQLENALVNGTAIGGSRPKLTLDSHIAKLSLASDAPRQVVRREAFALELAEASGLNVCSHKLIQSLNRDVLVVDRFDRRGAGRLMVVSALTLSGLDDFMAARYSSYLDFADRLRELGRRPDEVGPELFHRIAFNIAVGNPDDHARNHAAFWDGKNLELTPVFDVEPFRSPGRDSNQAMAYTPLGERRSDLGLLVRAAPLFDLSKAGAAEIVDRVASTVHDGFSEAADKAGLSSSERSTLFGNIVLNPGIFESLPTVEAAWPQSQTRSATNRRSSEHGMCGAPTTAGHPCRRRGECPFH